MTPEAADIEQIDARWLSDALNYPVHAVRAERVGTGQTGASYRLHLDADCGPSTVLAKVANGTLEARQRVAGGYAGEVGFYTLLEPTLDIRVPQCFYAAISDDQAAAYCDQFFPLNFMGRRLDGELSMQCRAQSVGSRIFGQSALANFAVCHVRNVVKIDARMPLKLAGPLGCGLQTGAGAVLNSLAIPQGAEVLVLGAGAVGLAAIMAASSIVGAATVAALDIHPSRLELAQSVGATQVFDGRRDDVFATLQAAFPAGVQYIIDTTGQVDLVNQCAALLATRGRLGLVASYDPQSMLSMNAVTVLTRGQHVQGIMAGDSDIQRLIPELVAHYLEGRFPIDRLVRYYAFAEVNDAVSASRSGSVVKPIVVMAD